MQAGLVQDGCYRLVTPAIGSQGFFSSLNPANSALPFWHLMASMVIKRFAALLIPAIALESELVHVDDECAEGTECALSAIQLRGVSKDVELSNSTDSGPACADLNDPANEVCAPVVRWASDGGRWDPNADSWFKDMQAIAGVDYKSASRDDWQKLYFCAPPGGKQCGTPPCKCSNPPCNVCIQTGQSPSTSSNCGDDSNSIACKPPKKALDYNGMAWEDMEVKGMGPHHIFAIGIQTAIRIQMQHGPCCGSV